MGGEHPNPLEYRPDDPTPAGGMTTWLLVLLVWALGLCSWALWTSLFIYGFFRFFS